MDLSQGSLQGFRNRQSQMGCVLQNAYTLIRQIEEDHRCPDHTSRSNDLHINDVGDATRRKISTFLQIPLNPTWLDSFLSAAAHIMPVR